MDGTDDPSNIERITIEEHAQRHLELYEKYGYVQDHIAYRMLSGQIDKAEAIKLLQKAPKSERWKKQASERTSGENNPMYGKTISEDHKKAISEANKGKTLSQEHIERIRETWTGRNHTEESKQKMSKSLKNRNYHWAPDRIPPMTGKKQTDKQKQAVRNANSTQWKITTPNGEQFIIVNLRAWAKENGLDQGNLSRGGNGSHKGYRALRLTNKGQI